MNTDFLKGLLKDTDVRIEEDYSLRERSYIKIDTVVRFAAFPTDSRGLCSLVGRLKECGVPFVLLGGVSNTLFAKKYYDGVAVICDGVRGKRRAERLVTLDCGVRLSGALALYERESLGGAEELSHVPGAVGGLVNSNAGAFGLEISDIFVCAVLYRLSDGATVCFDKGRMDFSYRNSILRKKEHILLNATFALKEASRWEIRRRKDEFLKRRLETQPIEYPSLGSIFKKHCGVGAGYYIEKAGLKGSRCGGAEISEKHAGFIVNRAEATAEDVLTLIERAKTRVFELFGIILEEEIEIIY